MHLSICYTYRNNHHQRKKEITKRKGLLSSFFLWDFDRETRYRKEWMIEERRNRRRVKDAGRRWLVKWGEERGKRRNDQSGQWKGTKERKTESERTEQSGQWQQWKEHKGELVSSVQSFSFERRAHVLCVNPLSFRVSFVSVSWSLSPYWLEKAKETAMKRNFTLDRKKQRDFHRTRKKKEALDDHQRIWQKIGIVKGLDNTCLDERTKKEEKEGVVKFPRKEGLLCDLCVREGWLNVF